MIYIIVDLLILNPLILNSDSVIQRVVAISAAIYTPIGIALNILLLALILFVKHDEIKNYKM
jgi:hypothetical protein